MKIRNVRRAAGRALATFDLEIGNADLWVRNCYIKRNSRGALRLYAPSPGDRRLVTFSPAFANQIIAAAVAVVEGRAADDAT